VRDSNAEFGTTDAHGTLPKELPICGVMADSQASLFALGCHQIGDTKVTFGTGSSLLMNIGSNASTAESGAVTTVAWVLDGKPTYCLEGIVNYSAATVEWLKNQLHLIDDAAESAALADSVDDNGGVYLIPAFAGLSAPYWNADARAAILGMSAHSTKAHVVRAALESIAYQVRDVLEMMKEEARVAPTRINADGGATSNEFLMQFTADIVNVELHTAQVSESSPLGAARCGALGRGVYSTLDELAELSSMSKEYRPKMERSVAGAFYEGWKRAVDRVL
jgi:glycerol kinase